MSNSLLSYAAILLWGTFGGLFLAIAGGAEQPAFIVIPVIGMSIAGLLATFKLGQKQRQFRDLFKALFLTGMLMALIDYLLVILPGHWSDGSALGNHLLGWLMLTALVAGLSAPVAFLSKRIRWQHA